MRIGNRSSRLSLLLLCAAAVVVLSASWANGFPEDSNNNDVQDARKLLIDRHHMQGPRDPNAHHPSVIFFDHFSTHGPDGDGDDGEREKRWERIRDWRVEHGLDEKKPAWVPEREPEEGVLSRAWNYVSAFTNPWRAFFHPMGHPVMGHWGKKPVEHEHEQQEQEQEQGESRRHRHYWHGGPRHGHFLDSRHMQHDFHHKGPRSFFHRIRDSIWKRPGKRALGNYVKADGGYESSGVLVPTVAKTLDGFFRSTPVAKEPTTTCVGMWEQDVKALVHSLKDALETQCDSATGQFSHNKICNLYKVNPKAAALLAFHEAEENPVHVAMMRSSSQDVGDCGDSSVSKGWHLVKTLHRHLIGRLGSHFSPEHAMGEHFMQGLFRRHEHEGHFRHRRFHEHEHERKEDEHPFDLRATLQRIENAHHNVHHDAEHGPKEARRPWWRLWHAVHAQEGDARENDNAKDCKDCFVKGVHRLTRGIKAELSVMCASADDSELVEACQFAREHRCLTKTYLLSAIPVERMVAHRCRNEAQMRFDGDFPRPHHFGFRMGRDNPLTRPFELGVEERHPHVMEDGPLPLMPHLGHFLRGRGGCSRHRANLQAYRRAMQLRGYDKNDNEFPGPLIRTHLILLKGHQIRPEDVRDIPFGPRPLGPGHFRDMVLKLQEHMKKMEEQAESESAPAVEESKTVDETFAKPLRQHLLPAKWKNLSRNFRISANPNQHPHRAAAAAEEKVSEPSFLTALKEKVRRFRISAKPQPMPAADVNAVEENNAVVKEESSMKATDSELKKDAVVEDHSQVIYLP